MFLRPSGRRSLHPQVQADLWASLARVFDAARATHWIQIGTHVPLSRYSACTRVCVRTNALMPLVRRPRHNLSRAEFARATRKTADLESWRSRLQCGSGKWRSAVREFKHIDAAAISRLNIIPFSLSQGFFLDSDTPRTLIFVLAHLLFQTNFFPYNACFSRRTKIYSVIFVIAFNW